MRARNVRRATAAAALAAAALAPAAAQAKPPTIDQLVAFKDGSAKQKRVSARATTVKVGRKRCAVTTATPLAALARSNAGALKFTDYGSCSRKPADAAGLYVRQIAGDRAKGANGWVYKVGNRVGTAGAADPAGPFGRGRLKNGNRVTWFYCRMNVRTGSCQRTLGIRAVPKGGGAVEVTVRGYDDRGRGKPVKGATVHGPNVTGKTDAGGRVTVGLDPGSTARVWATARGLVRSFEETVEVR